MAGRTSKAYDCDACEAYCCAYPVIPVEPADVARLAAGLGKSRGEVVAGYLRGGKRLQMRHSEDPLFGSSCVLLDKATRRCKAYESRPAACQAHPLGNRCEWADRQAIESRMAGRRVIMLRELPWASEGRFADYGEHRKAALEAEYGAGGGAVSLRWGA